MPTTNPLKKRNRSLYGALLLFTKEALETLRKAVDEGVKIPVYSEPSWVRQGDDDVFVRQEVPRARYWMFVRKLKSSIEALQTYQVAQSAIQSDQLWSFHVNKIVGSASNASRIDADGVLLAMPEKILSGTGEFDFSQKLFDEHVNEFEKMVCSQTVEYTRVTPFYGTTIQDPVLFSESSSLQALTDEQVMKFLDVGLILGTSFGAGADFVNNPPRTALVTKYSLPKVVRGDSESLDPPDPDLLKRWSRLESAEATAIELLALIQSVAITPVGSVTKSSGPTNFGSHFQRSAIGSSLAHRNVSLSQDAKDRFCKLWPVVSDESGKSKHFLAIAIRRFALAMSRPSPDDKLIDLMICAEALFLQEDGGSEITHKLAERAAVLLGSSAKNRREIFKFFKTSYQMRSKIVHGSKSLMTDQTEVEKLNLTIGELSGHLREAILKMLEIAMNPHPPKGLVDWVELMFPEEVTP